jgi:hypothetical protein
VAAVAAACTGGGSPGNGIVEVTNEALDSATFAWNTPGPFGNLLFPDTGQEVIDGCSTYRRGFGPGVTTVTIWHGQNSINIVLSLTKNDQGQTHYVLVDPSGAVAQVDQASVPPEPCPTS